MRPGQVPIAGACDTVSWTWSIIGEPGPAQRYAAAQCGIGPAGISLAEPEQWSLVLRLEGDYLRSLERNSGTDARMVHLDETSAVIVCCQLNSWRQQCVNHLSLGSHAQVFPLGIFIRPMACAFAAEAGLLETTKGRHGVGYQPFVDANDARFQCLSGPPHAVQVT